MSSRLPASCRVILIGRLVAAPEVRTLAGGGRMATLRIATTHTDRSRRLTEEHELIALGRPAEAAGALPARRLAHPLL